MSFESGLVAYLKAHSGLSALVGTRVYPDTIPEGVESDCLTYQLVGGRELRVGSYLEPSFLIKSWSKHEDNSRANTIAIDLQVRNALEGYHGAVGDYHVRVRTHIGMDGYEPETGWRSRARYAEPIYREALT